MIKILNSDWIDSHYYVPVSLAFFVTFLWSSSFVIIKWGLADIPPIIFSGLRYFIASIILLIMIISQKKERNHLKSISKQDLFQFLIYGVVFVFLTQGFQFLGLYYLPAIDFSLILNLTIIIVLLSSNILLKEFVTKREILLILVTILGIYLYFDDKLNLTIETIGLVIGILALLSNSISTLFGRHLNKSKRVSSLVLTGVSMTFGSSLLIIFGFTLEKVPDFSPINIFYILWLAVFNTALAFTLWNYSMSKLRAIDSALINSFMLPQIVILSLIFLNEYPNFVDWIGIILVASAIITIQMKQSNNNNVKSEMINVIME